MKEQIYYAKTKITALAALNESYRALDTARQKNTVNGVILSQKRKFLEDIMRFIHAADQLTAKFEQITSTHHDQPPAHYSTAEHINQLKKESTPETKEAARFLSITNLKENHPELF